MQYEIHEKFNRDAGRETKSSSHSFTNLNNIGLAGLTVSYSDSSLKKSEISQKNYIRSIPDTYSNSSKDSINKAESNIVATTVKYKFEFELPCQIENKETISALQRAKTLECKKQIASVSCQIANGTFYPSKLVSFCPTHGRIKGKSLGCYKDNRENRILKGHLSTLKKNSPNICAELCLQRGYIYAGVQYSKECFCGNNDIPSEYRVPDRECNMNCTGDDTSLLRCGGFLRAYIVETGLGKTNISPLVSPGTNSSVRIAYILTLNGRALRQVYRVFKALFHIDHYFILHVDSRQYYLYRELLKLENSFNNVILSRKRLSSIWGGSSLLTVLLHCMELAIRKDWKWDFIINLSESDFPVKPNKDLVDFLSVNKNRNFLKSHGHETHKFLKRQGLDRTFLQCDNHMWILGERKLPAGIRIDGGSDWICLNRKFVEYVVLSEDMMVEGLKHVFSYSLLPAESFFHTVLRNSEYCQTIADNNLHITNWKRKLGCRCQHKHIVDWCGCSPNDFTLKDWHKFENSKNKHLFFARKFESVKSVKAINKVDEWIYGQYDPELVTNLNSYWENIYHYEDPPNAKGDVELTFFHSIMRLAASQITDLISSGIVNRVKEPQDWNIVPVLPSQAFTYHAHDRFQGIIIEFIARTKSGIGLKFEALAEYQNQLEVIHYNDFSKRIIKMEINVNLDLKEQMFRNFGQYLGPTDELIVALWFTQDLETETEKDDKKVKENEEVEIILIDPLEIVAARQKVKVLHHEISSHSIPMNKPLRPGIWTAFLAHNGKILASLRFPILPLQFAQARQISISEGRSLHVGPGKPYSNISYDILNTLKSPDSKPNFSVSLYPGNKSLLKEADQLGRSFGPALAKWIDEIVERSYQITELCHISQVDVSPIIKKFIPVCEESHWSSHSPDPKAELTEIEIKTGRLKDPYRLPKKS
ncbi:UNVERIFIED_CONTAM: hypothetical protein RMT77_009163 [Armadillidium vulgare]